MGYDPGRSERLTMGTALDMAEKVGAPIRVLVDGHWVSGRMGKRDGIGVSIFMEGSVELATFDRWVVVKQDAIHAVEVPADLEHRPAIEAS
jgi:hypothetical protein